MSDLYNRGMNRYLNRTLFYPVVFSFIVGIFFRSVYEVSNSVALFAALLLFISVLYFLRTGLVYQNRELKRYTVGFSVLVGGLFFVVGIIRYNSFVSYQGDPVLQSSVNKSIAAEGIVVDEPDERDKKILITVDLKMVDAENSVSAINSQSHEQNITLHSLKRIQDTKIIASIPLYTDISYGDLISIKGTLKVPQIINEPGEGKPFDYPSYLRKSQIFYEITQPTISIENHHKGNIIIEKLFAIKHIFIHALDDVIPFPESGLAAGLIVAGKKALPPSVQLDFQKSGTLQIVVLSGYNITIVVETLAALLSFLPRLLGIGVGALGIILFTIMAGASASIVRASVMAMLVLIAQLTRRKYNVGRALIISGVLMLIQNPMPFGIRSIISALISGYDWSYVCFTNAFAIFNSNNQRFEVS